MPRYLYIHIPFCLKKCIYCDFYSVPRDDVLIDSYIAALVREIEIRKGLIVELDTIYIGGGTPSILRGRDIDLIMGGIRLAATISVDAEITSEANPGTLTERGIGDMLAAGINRISIGVQSLDDKELSALGRMHNSHDAISAFNAARNAGCKNISVDLIYGIPGQTPGSWERTLGKVISLHPEHISAYELTPEKNTPLFEKLCSGKVRLPDEDAVAGMYYRTIDMLAGAGYRHYEISNFALPDKQCRHNLNYWNRGWYLGVGAGAHSFLDGQRIANLPDVGRYIDDIMKDILPVAEETVLTGQDELEEMLFLGLRKTEGVAIELIPADAMIKMKEALDELSHQGLLEIAEKRIRLTRKGLIVCNRVIVRLMLCIERSRPA